MLRRGFSLVELSIVLVILGLLVGGILAGRSLIRAAELRAVGTEYQRYKTAMMAFRDKYFQAPGDFRDATRFWGRMSTTGCPTYSSAAISSTGTCDGNADGSISGAGGGASSERFQIWRHLALSGMIEGEYSGMAGASGSTDCEAGVNCPVSKINNASWMVQTLNNFAGDTAAYAMNYGNAFVFGGLQAGGGPFQKIITPIEAWNIDSKMDDGLPASGRVIGRFWNNACSEADDGNSANDDLVASYRLSDTTIQCAFYFRNIF